MLRITSYFGQGGQETKGNSYFASNALFDQLITNAYRANRQPDINYHVANFILFWIRETVEYNYTQIANVEAIVKQGKTEDYLILTIVPNGQTTGYFSWESSVHQEMNQMQSGVTSVFSVVRACCPLNKSFEVIYTLVTIVMY